MQSDFENIEKQSGRVAYRAKEVAAATGLSLETVRKAIRKGDLKTTHVGRAVLISPQSLSEWLRGQEQPA